MGIEAKTNNYWIAPNAISISLNALGYENRIYGSVASGSVISCYMDSIAPGGDNGDGLGLDNGRNPKRWLLTISPTYFNSDMPKYVYVAIPRRASFGTQAIVVFPSEQIDIYGKNENDEQIGSVDYFYIWLRGIISAPVEKNGKLQREWTQQIIWGSLGTYEDIVDMSVSDWYAYSKEFDTVSFLKRIVMKAGSFFDNIFLGDEDHELTGVATAATDDEYIDSDTLVATPNYLHQHYLRKDADDEATGLIRFAKGLWSRSIEVLEDVIIGGTLRVAKSIITKTIQSVNYNGDSQFGTGWQLTDNDGNGNSRLTVDNLFVRMKAVFNELEVRKFVAMGGNYVFSPAASIIEEVDYIHLVRDEQTGEVTGEEVLGYEYVKVPWLLRLVPMSLAGRFLSKKKLVRSSSANINWQDVDVFRCWLKSDDGTTRTINTWSVGMLARCQTFDVSQGSGGGHSGTWNGQNIENKLYWRAVVAIGTALTKQDYTETTHILDDGLAHNYIDLANYTDENDVTLYYSGSDNPEALDNIVCYGNWKNSNLSNLIVIETVGEDAPAIKEFLGVGYTDGTDIDWTLTNKMRTRISPKSGNIFIAPDFKVITTNGNVGLAESVQSAGLNIDGTNSKFVAKANTFEVQNSSGNTTFSVDADGNLQSSGGASFKGKITATSGQIGNVTIDENGNLVTSGNAEFSGKINASSGSISGFNIEKVNNTPTLRTNVANSYNLSLNNEGIEFKKDVSGNEDKKFLVGSADNIIAAIGAKDYVSQFLNFLCALQIGAEGTAGLCAALDITKGVVSGLRFPVTIINESSVFGGSISIVCDNLVGSNSSSAVHVRSGGVFIISGTTQRTISLPNGVENGTIYTFLFYTNNATISPGSANIYKDGNPNGQSEISSNGIKTAKLIYASGNWYAITQ